MLAWVGLLAAARLFAQVPITNPVPSVAALQGLLSNHVHQPRFEPAVWGVKVVSLESGRTLFTHNPTKLLSPASNSKLYTCAVALDRLGPDHRIRTSLYAVARPDVDGTLRGDLTIYGRGDPTFNTRRHGDLGHALAPLVAALMNAGVRRVAGDLVADESFLRGPPFGSGWTWDDLQGYYGAELSALSINDNILRVTIKPGATTGAPATVSLAPATTLVAIRNRAGTIPAGGRRALRVHRPIAENTLHVAGEIPLQDAGLTETVAIRQPARLFAAEFRAALERAGIRVDGSTRVVGWLDRAAPPDPGEVVELGFAESPPLRELLREIQKPSQNLYTDLLLGHLGALAQATNATLAALTSEDAGLRELRAFLAEAGVPRNQVHFEEGSGLSRNNLTTAAATLRLLEYMARHRWADAYLQALPIAGVDGTLRNRMQDTAAAGNARAKTGTLRWANSLSGYVTTAAGERLAFAIMLNRYAPAEAARPARAEIDVIPDLLARLAARTGDEER